MKNRIPTFDDFEFINEAKQQVFTIDGFVDEITSFIDTKDLKQLSIKSTIDTKNDGEFRRLVLNWSKGKYDNDIEYVKQELAHILTRKPISNLYDLYNFALHTNRKITSELTVVAMKLSKINGKQLSKLVTMYLAIDPDEIINSDPWWKFVETLQDALKKEGVLEPSRYIRACSASYIKNGIDTYNFSDGNTSWYIYTTDEDLEKIKKEIIKYAKKTGLNEKLFHWYEQDADLTNTKGIDVFMDLYNHAVWKKYEAMRNEIPEGKMVENFANFLKELATRYKLTYLTK